MTHKLIETENIDIEWDTEDYRSNLRVSVTDRTDDAVWAMNYITMTKKNMLILAGKIIEACTSFEIDAVYAYKNWAIDKAIKELEKLR